MKSTLAVAAIFAAAVLVLAGCGGDGSSDSAADEQSITELVGELNRITAGKDASGFCDVMQPSGVKANFNSRGRCVRETTRILQQAGPQPTLNIEDIAVDGDQATVNLEGSVGELSLVRENGEWYIAFSDTGSGGSGSAGQEASGDQPPAGDSGSGG
ncbi:MAG: hypothetical protein JJE10_02835 [Thermoleophilia bacterium]|nr:hypothetical protein [Thermoleophilia bacterium]